MFLRPLAVMTVIAISATACTQPGQQGGLINKEQGGAILGALAGGVAGSQFGKGKGQLAMVGLGTLLGAGIGSQVGASLDKMDMTYYNQTSQRALESGRSGSTVTWQNPDSGNGGTITPTRTYQVAGGEYCREYTQTIKVGGKTQSGYGTACRQPDGSWQVRE